MVTTERVLNWNTLILQHRRASQIGAIAISHLRNVVEVPIEINGTGMSSGTFEFIGSALVFHKTTGEPFTVTYTIDAQVKSLKE